MAIGDGEVYESEAINLDNKKRRVLVDRYARLKIDEAAMAQVAAAANGADDLSAQTRQNGGPSNVQAASQMGGTNAERAAEERRRASEGDATARRAAGKEYMAEPYKTGLLPGEEIVSDRSGRKTFLGAPAGQSMLRRVSLNFMLIANLLAARTHVGSKAGYCWRNAINVGIRRRGSTCCT